MLLTVPASSLESCLVAPRANVARHKADSQALNHIVPNATKPESKMTRPREKDKRTTVRKDAVFCHCSSRRLSVDWKLKSDVNFDALHCVRATQSTCCESLAGLFLSQFSFRAGVLLVGAGSCKCVLPAVRSYPCSRSQRMTGIPNTVETFQHRHRQWIFSRREHHRPGSFSLAQKSGFPPPTALVLPLKK